MDGNVPKWLIKQSKKFMLSLFQNIVLFGAFQVIYSLIKTLKDVNLVTRRCHVYYDI